MIVSPTLLFEIRPRADQLSSIDRLSHGEVISNREPSLAEVAVAAAQLDDSPLADELDLLRRAADEVVRLKPDADADDVLVYAAALRSGQAAHGPTSPAAAAS